jgi:uncharacterized membrane protein
MSHLVVITFDGVEEAGRVRQELRQIQRSDALRLDDAVVVYKDEQGKVRTKDEIDIGVRRGAISGGVLGLILGMVFPVAGLLVGAAAGALVGKTFDMGVDKSFVKEVEAALPPGHSALFLLVQEANTEIALAALRPYQGTVYHTSLSPELEATLERALQTKHTQG